MNIALIGSRGLLGSALVDELGPLHRLHVFDRPDVDLGDGSGLEAIIRLEPDALANCAGWTNKDTAERDTPQTVAELYRINVDGAELAARTAWRARALLVHVSDAEIFDGLKRSPYLPTDKPNPWSMYGSSKLEAENRVRMSAGRWVIVRSSAMFGPGRRGFVEDVIDTARSGKPIRAISDQVTRPTYSRHLARAIGRVISLPSLSAGRTLHVANRGQATWYEFAREIVRRTGIKSTIIPITSEEAKQPARRSRYSVLDLDEFESLARWKMPHWWDGLREHLGDRTP